MSAPHGRVCGISCNSLVSVSFGTNVLIDDVSDRSMGVSLTEGTFTVFIMIERRSCKFIDTQLVFLFLGTLGSPEDTYS